MALGFLKLPDSLASIERLKVKQLLRCELEIKHIQILHKMTLLSGLGNGHRAKVNLQIFGIKYTLSILKLRRFLTKYLSTTWAGVF